MNKEEFLKRVNNILDNLVKEKYYIMSFNDDDKPYDYEHQLRVLNSKISHISSIINLPAYTRIQAMSDVEIEEYKIEKSNELKLKISELEEEEKQTKINVERLKTVRSKIMADLKNLTGIEYDKTCLDAKQFDKNIDVYLAKCDYLQRSINDIQMEINNVLSMTTEVVRQELLSKIENNYKLSQELKYYKSLEREEALIAAVATSKEQTERMANLLTTYRRLSQIYPTYVDFTGFCNLPKFKTYDSENGRLYNPDKLMGEVEDFEVDFKNTIDTYNKEFTEEKLSKLVGMEGPKMGDYDIDFEFLQLHSDKLDEADLKILNILVTKRKQLSQKIIKSRKTKEELDYLNKRIDNKYEEICKHIIGWYKSFNTDKLGIYNGLLFYNLEEIKEELKNNKRYIAERENAIEDAKKYIENAKLFIEKQKINRQNEINNIIQKIKELVGDKFNDVDLNNMLFLGSKNVEITKNNVYNMAGIAKKNEIINMVQNEAQVEADLKEAELRGISYNQLQMLKQQTQMMTNQPQLEDLDESEREGTSR